MARLVVVDVKIFARARIVLCESFYGEKCILTKTGSWYIGADGCPRIRQTGWNRAIFFCFPWINQPTLLERVIWNTPRANNPLPSRIQTPASAAGGVRSLSSLIWGMRWERAAKIEKMPRRVLSAAADWSDARLACYFNAERWSIKYSTCGERSRARP